MDNTQYEKTALTYKQREGLLDRALNMARSPLNITFTCAALEITHIETTRLIHEEDKRLKLIEVIALRECPDYQQWLGTHHPQFDCRPGSLINCGMTYRVLAGVIYERLKKLELKKRA